MHALCRRHRHVKHQAGWQVRGLADGSVEWTSPLGRVYVLEPLSYATDTTHRTYTKNDNPENTPDRGDRAA
jgi:hypothetical protein